MALELWLTLAVIVVALILFVTEVVTVDLAALIVMSLLLVLGLVTPEEGISGFSNPATITVLAMFILSAGVERTGAVNLLAQRVAKFAGNRLLAQLVAILVIVAPVSAFINNTAAVAILLPLVVGLARETGHPPSKLLIPLSFASMLGGVVTLIGTSTNLLASSISARLGHGAFQMFEFTAPGVVVALVGLAYLVGVAPFLLPDRGIEKAARYNVQEYLSEVVVAEEGRVAGKSLAQLDLTGRYNAEVVRVSRGGVESEPTAATVLEPGDRVLLLGEREKLIQLASLEGFTFQASGEEPPTPKEMEKILFYEALVAPQSRLVGRTLQTARFRSRFGGTVVAVRKSIRVFRTFGPIARAHLDTGDALLIAGTEEDRARVEESDDLLLVDKLGGRAYRREKMFVALAIFAGVVGVAATGLADILVTSLVGASLMALLGVLNMEEFHRAIRWDILFLLAGVIPLGIAMQRSGLADAIASVITGFGRDVPPLAALILVYGVTTVLTEIVSNNAAVVLLAPVAAATAVALDLNPKTFILAVAFAASTSFLTPIGYQTNTLVYGPGGYRFSDYARVGLPLNLVLVFVSPYVLSRFFPL